MNDSTEHSMVRVPVRFEDIAVEWRKKPEVITLLEAVA